MKLSKIFLPTIKENPADVHIISHSLMLRAGMINQVAAGIYSWLPLGTRVLHKIAEIVRSAQNKIGANEVILPTIQPANLWIESGRYEAYGDEMLRIKDRHDRDLLYTPTAEEVVTQIGKQFLKSYKDLPQLLYQIHWKFRDEIRPRFGVMRGREFIMKDAYSFDIDQAQAKITYEKVFICYMHTFAKMGLTAIPIRADTGPIGGNLSHEFHVLAQTGESAIYYDRKINDIIDQVSKGQKVDFNELTKYYAAADEMHQPEQCPLNEQDLCSARGIEVGHIFNFGDKYTKAMNMSVMNDKGQKVYPSMGSYGIGISRLVGAIIEANHDDRGIIWPMSVAPFHVGLIGIKLNDPLVSQKCAEIYEKLQSISGLEVLYDDRNESPGFKFANMDLIGIPIQVVIGPKALEQGQIEVKLRRSGDKLEVSFDQIIDFIKEQLKGRE